MMAVVFSIGSLDSGFYLEPWLRGIYFILFLFFSTQVAWVVMVNAGDIRDMGQEDPLEKNMTAHSSILAWRIPWTEEPGGL